MASGTWRRVTCCWLRYALYMRSTGSAAVRLVAARADEPGAELSRVSTASGALVSYERDRASPLGHASASARWRWRRSGVGLPIASASVLLGRPGLRLWRIAPLWSRNTLYLEQWCLPAERS